MFDGNYPASHCDKLLNQTATDSRADPALRAYARNFLVDHRVSFDRGRAWAAAHPFAKMDGFVPALKSYYDTKINTSNNPEFLERHNDANIVYGGAAKRSLLPPSAQLVCCIDLSGLHRVLRVMKDVEKDPYLREISDPYPSAQQELSDDVRQWHDRRLLGRPAKDHVGAIVKILRKYTAGGRPFHPVWATLERRFEAVADPARPENWLARVGVWRCFNVNRWVAVLRYPVERATTLLRPTVLDCGEYKYHHPSPKQAPLGEGGHPVSLDPKSISTLIPEFIHQQIEFNGNDVKPEFVGWIRSAAKEEPLPDLRSRHRRALVGRYGQGVSTWCPD